MIKRLWLILFVLPLISATQLPLGFQEDLLVYGLRQPVCAEYSPDGRLFILEKQGRIRIYKNGRLLPKAFLKVNVNGLYERGLLGIAFDPNFQNNHYLYIYRTTDAAVPSNIVERYTASGDHAIVSSRVTILSGIHSDAGIHNAGCLRFGTDGKLYVSTGDGGLIPNNGQDLQSSNGKVLRINSDGTVPEDNPFVGRADARGEIYCYGLRNPWRFTIHPRSGLLVIGDVGGDNFEEINIGRPGANFGWPVVEGPAGNPSFVDPVLSYSHDAGGAAIVVGGFYTGNKFPAKYRNRLFITDYGRKFIHLIKLASNGAVLSSADLATELTSPVHMLESPDGSLLYLNISSGEIRKVKFVGGRNRPPVVESGATNRSGPVPLTTRLNSSGTFDPDGQPLSYEWDFGDGQKSDVPNTLHTYTVKGTYYAVLTARDDHGGVGYGRPIKFSVGNTAPVAIILTPANGTVVHNGEIIHFSGKGTDLEDGRIPPENMVWSAKLYHNDHTHPALGGVRGRSGSFPVPPAFHDTGTLIFRLHLRVTDSEGLSSIASVDLPWK
jgi:glucose/arabinose dehydrogenase